MVGINGMVIASANRQGVFITRNVNIDQLFYCRAAGFPPENGKASSAGFAGKWGQPRGDIHKMCGDQGFCKSIKGSGIAMLDLRSQLADGRSTAEALQHCLSVLVHRAKL